MISPTGPTRSAARLGYWSALLTAFFCLLFTIAAVFTEAHLLPAPWDVVLTIAPSLLLAPSFLAMLVCVNALTHNEQKIWSQLGVAFAGAYVPLCVAAYIVELFVVEPRLLRGVSAQMALLTLARDDSVFNAIDGIGYIFMCLSTLVAAQAFDQAGLERWIRRLFVVNGILAVPIFLTYFVNRSFIWMAGLWSVTITGSAILLSVHFHRVGKLRATVGES